VKPKVQQNKEETRKIIKEKVDIKNMIMEISKFKKGNNGHSGLSCRQGLQNTKGDKLGNDFKITESLPRKPKVKIINVGKDELEMDDKDLRILLRSRMELKLITIVSICGC